MSTMRQGAPALGSKLDALAAIAEETSPERRRALLRHATAPGYRGTSLSLNSRNC